MRRYFFPDIGFDFSGRSGLSGGVMEPRHVLVFLDDIHWARSRP